MITGSTILVINCGSSSVRFALFGDDDALPRLWSGSVQGIGLAEARLRAMDADGGTVMDARRPVADHVAALAMLLEALGKAPVAAPGAVGHRVVHGGTDGDRPMRIDPNLQERLRRLIPLAPLHLPHNLAGIEAVGKASPDLTQVACFDTAFHHDLPRLARLTGLPRAFADRGVRRYGFHGLSCEYVMAELERRHGPGLHAERIVIAHLGNGASMTAVHGGHSVDTSMGFSTLAGLPMGTRSGDLDPGILLHLLTAKGMSADALQRLLYEESGLLGLSGISGDMRELLARQDVAAAAEAVDYFCYQARKQLGALCAALGGLDRLVFTGGIGAHAAPVRSRICAGLDCLGIVIDEARNAPGAGEISAASSRVRVEAMQTDEELMIARHVRRLLSADAT